MIACGAVWLLQFFLGPVAGLDVASVSGQQISPRPSLQWFGLVPGNVISGMVWQPFTYIWLHGDLLHLLLNMFILWMLGGDLERHWGSRAFLRYFLVCGVGAGMFILVAGLLSEPWIPTIGASGAIFGVILAFGMIFSQRVILFMMIFPMRARTFSWLMFAIVLLSLLGQSVGNVSHVAHLGGMVVGYLYLKRAWRIGEFVREIRWRIRRRKLRVMPPGDDDRWVN